MKNKMKQLRKTAALCAVAVLVSGCSEDWSQVTIVDEGHAGAVQVGLEREETEFQTIHQETAAEGREETVAGEEEPIPETEPAETENVPFALLNRLDISAEAYCVIDGETGAVVSGYRPNGQYAPASITKVLTALIVAEQCPDLSATVEVTRADIDAVAMLSSTMSPMIREDEVMSVQDLLYGMLLESSNACATVLARYVSGSETKFAKLMNARIAEIGATDSHFVNPHGLDAEGQYVSARDMALIMQEALRNPVTALALSTASYQTQPTNLFGSRILKMGHMMVNGDIPVNGVYAGKTGFTLQAGYTMVTAARRDGHSLIAVTLGSTYGSNYGDMEAVIEYGFACMSGADYQAAPHAYTPRLAELDENHMTLQCQVNRGATDVKYAVWSLANGQDDLVWYDCTVEENTATAYIPLSDHNYETGRYEAACYVTNEEGQQSGISIDLLVTGRNLERGMVSYGDSMYYINEDGRVKFGFIETLDGNFYADSEGRLQMGVTGDEDCKTLTGADYRIIDGFGEWEGHTYYVQKSGELMTGRCAIDGKGYLFDLQTGILLEES